jgi:hypothetical protein
MVVVAMLMVEPGLRPAGVMSERKTALPLVKPLPPGHAELLQGCRRQRERIDRRHPSRATQEGPAQQGRELSQIAACIGAQTRWGEAMGRWWVVCARGKASARPCRGAQRERSTLFRDMLWGTEGGVLSDDHSCVLLQGPMGLMGRPVGRFWSGYGWVVETKSVSLTARPSPRSSGHEVSDKNYTFRDMLLWRTEGCSFVRW